MLHLKDSVECAKGDIQQNLSQLEAIDQYLIGLARLSLDHHNMFEKESYKDHAQIESQNALKSRNTTMLTFLVAVYVPLAFVTVSDLILLDEEITLWVLAEVLTVFPGNERYRSTAFRSSK